MESNNSLEVNDIEVPPKTDQNQSNNGLEISGHEESASNSEMESIDDQNNTSDKSETKDETKESQPSEDGKPTDNDSRHQYSKEQLIQISKSSSARVRPKCLDNSFNNASNGLWNPEKWISSRSPAATASNKYNYNKRVDPKDRVIDEETDIILSPQRGSFGTGCHVSSNSFGSSKASNDSRSRDHYMERNKMDESNDGSHRSNLNSRRVGTGRIVVKERERSNDWSDRNYDRTYDHRDGRDNRDIRNDDSYERRSGRYGRDDRRPNRDIHSNRNFQRYGDNQRHKYREEEEAPEWFTEGPISKHDTIELRGFDDDSTEISSKSDNDFEDKSRDKSIKDIQSNVENQNKSEPKVNDPNDMKKELNTDDFDVNAMFGNKDEDWFGKEYETHENNKTSNSSVGISENVNNESDVNVKSRFKRWFNESPNQTISSNVSDFAQLNTSVNRQKESQITASIVRPLNTQMSNPLSPDKLFELLSNGSNRQSIEQISSQKFDPRKAMSLAEIEANLSQIDVNNSRVIDDKRVFDKLMFDLNKKSVQPSNMAERVQNELKNETTLLQTPDAHVIIPKSMRNAPSILELLKEQESKEAMADLHRSGRRVNPNQAPTHSNGNNINQNSVNNPMFRKPSLSNSGPNPSEQQNWENSSHLMNSSVRPSRNPSNHEMSEQTNLMLQKALQVRQTMGQMNVRPQSQSDTIRANANNRSASNFLIPTSVMRNMHSDKERDSVKSVLPFNDMTSESNSSQYKFSNESFISKPSPMRPIVKSNNPIGQSMAPKSSPLSSHSDSMAFSANTLAGLQSHLFHSQQTPSTHTSTVNSFQRPINTPNPSVRSFNLGHNSINRTSAHSPNAINNIAINSNQNILQMINNPNVRTNQMRMNQMMALQHKSAFDGRQSQYSQSRPITATNVQQMLLNNTNSDPFNLSFERNMMSESDALKTSIPTTYSQPRPLMQQMFPNSGPSQPNRNNESRFFGQIFGHDSVHQSLPELPTVPLHNALTLDDIERS